MDTSEFVLRSIDIDKDAGTWAEMWNASDDAWPGTFTGGVPMTAEHARKRYEREDAFETLVWDTGDKIAGSCSLWEDSDDPSASYIALLNVAPQFQGLGLAREFLVDYVDRESRRGTLRTDLDTWSGNLPAVPLYKKCGYFWEPGTSVHMMNFMPGILSIGLLKDFFDRNYWYDAFVRDLTISEDDERWEEMKVFTYRFQANDEEVVVWVDRASRRVTAIETPEILVGVSTTSSDVPKGLEAQLNFKIVNKASKPKQIFLLAEGDDHLRIDLRRSLELDPDETIEFQESVDVRADAPKIEENRASPRVTCTVIVDGIPVQLGLGMKPRDPVETSLVVLPRVVRPSANAKAVINLQNKLDRPMSGIVSILPDAGLHTDWLEHSFEVGPKEHVGVPITLTPAHEGGFKLGAGVEFEGADKKVTIQQEPMSVLSIEPGGTAVAQTKEFLHFANEHLRLTLYRKGAYLILGDTQSGQYVTSIYGRPGPPFQPSEFDSVEFDLSSIVDGSRTLLVAAGSSKKIPGVTLRFIYSVGSSGLISCVAEYENATTSDRRFQIQWANGGWRWETVTLPLRTGVFSGPTAEFPGVFDDGMRKPEAFAERWSFLGGRVANIGIIWPDDVEEILASGASVVSQSYEAKPHSVTRTAAMHLSIDRTDWHIFRDTYRSLKGIPRPMYAAAGVPDAPVSISWEAQPIMRSDEDHAVLLIRSGMAREVSGEVSIESGAGWGVDPNRFSFGPVSWDKPASQKLRLTGPKGASVSHAEVTLAGSGTLLTSSLSLVRIGSAGEVKVEKGESEGREVWSIDNGLTSAVVCPGFGGSVTSLTDLTGRNLLKTAFPDARPLVWINPWFGGITPYLMAGGTGYPGKLWEESFDAAETERTFDGLVWSGVIQRTVVRNEETKGFEVEIEMLTTAASPLWRYNFRVRNLTTAYRQVFAGPAFYTTAVDPMGSLRAVSPSGPLQQTERSFDGPLGPWVCMLDEAAERALTIGTNDSTVYVESMGKEGFYLAGTVLRALPPGSDLEQNFILAVAKDEAEGRSWGSAFQGSLAGIASP